MIASAMAWILGTGLMLYCLRVPVSVWKPDSRWAARSRRTLLAALLEIAFMVVLARLVIDWSPVTIWFWVFSVAALAAGTAGAVIRWDALPRPAAEAEKLPEDPQAITWQVNTRQPREPGTATLSSYALLLAAALAVSAAAG